MIKEEKVVVEEEEEKKVIPSFDELLKDETFQKTFKSKLDAAVFKGVETYRNGNFQEAVKKAVADAEEQKKHKTPEQIQLMEMTQKMETIQNELAKERILKTRSNNEKLVLKGLTEKGLPSGLSNFITADTEDDTLKNLENITKVISDYAQGLKSEQLKLNNIKVPSGENLSSGSIKEPGENATKEEWTAYFKAKDKEKLK